MVPKLVGSASLGVEPGSQHASPAPRRDLWSNAALKSEHGLVCLALPSCGGWKHSLLTGLPSAPLLLQTRSELLEF